VTRCSTASRAANPASPAEFDGAMNFDALGFEPGAARGLLATIPAIAAAALAAVVLLPASAPQAKEVVRRAVDAMALDQGGILYAETSVRASNGADFGTRRSGCRGDTCASCRSPAPATRRGLAGDHARRHDHPLRARRHKTMSMRAEMVPG
jgi:hypothetical protein